MAVGQEHPIPTWRFNQVYHLPERRHHRYWSSWELVGLHNGSFDQVSRAGSSQPYQHLRLQRGQTNR